MANSRNELIRAIKLIGKLDIVLVDSEIDDGAMPADVEDSVVLGCAHGLENLGVLELVLDDGIFEELDAFFVLVCLSALLVDGRVGTIWRGESDVMMRDEDVVRMGSY